MQLVVDKYGLSLQHLQTMSKDRSFKAADRMKFQGWLRKWQQARIPILVCLFIELLSPAKVLSLAFQSDEIDIVSSVAHIQSAKKQLECLHRIDLHDLLEKIQENDGQFQYQNVTLPSFNAEKESAKHTKTMLLGRIKEAMETRQEVAENKYVLMAATVLNCKGWEEDLEFADDCVAELYDHFKEPLSKAGGLNGLLDDLLDQWHHLLECTKLYLEPSKTPYFDSS